MERQIIGLDLDGGVPFWGSFMIKIVLPVLASLGC